MRIRRHAATPAHAPGWVRSRHWPAISGAAGIVALVAVLASVQATTPQRATSAPRHDVAAAAVHAGAGAADLVLAGDAGAANDGAANNGAADNGAADLGAVNAGVVSSPVIAAAALLAASPAGELGLPNTQPAPSDPATVSALAAGGIPLTALDAYQRAAKRELTIDPGCKIPWPLLAGIGRVESDHGRYGGAVLRSDGTSSQRIIGIPLDGSRSATITDTDGGRLDGDTVYDRAVGPMQFIPSTWASYGADGNGDGVKDPFNIYDAAAAAAHYLCTAGGDLSTLAGQTRAVLAYNHSTDYLALVLELERTYAVGVPGLVVPVLPAVPVPTATATASSTPGKVGDPGSDPVRDPMPPVDPGPPLGYPPSGPRPPHPPPTTPRPSSSAPASSAHPTSSAPSTSTSTSPSSPPVTTPAPQCPSSSGSATGSDSSSASQSSTESSPDSQSSTAAPTDPSTSDSASTSASSESSSPSECPAG